MDQLAGSTSRGAAAGDENERTGPSSIASGRPLRENSQGEEEEEGWIEQQPPFTAPSLLLSL
jgi:hypothetical protein